MTPHARQQRTLRRAGFLADASISGLVVWLPVSMLLLEAALWLTGFGLLCIALSALLVIGGTDPDAVVRFIIGFGAMPMVIGGTATTAMLVGQALVLQIERFHRFVSARMRLNVQSASLAGRTVPLEEIASLSAQRRGLQLVTLEATLRSGRRRVLAFGGHLENMEILSAVIEEQRSQRVAQLESEGQDLSEPAPIPAALTAIRQQPQRK